jgi:nitronate monooxygenase
MLSAEPAPAPSTADADAPATPDRALPPAELADRARAAGLAPLRLGGRELLPVVQGGMGVGVSAHRLAGSVAACGAVGTISSVDLRRHHPDLMARCHALEAGGDVAAAKAVIDDANQEALRREIAAAQALAQGRGLLAVNVMRAVSAYADSVRTALEAGIDAVVVGAGLPLDLPELAREHPKALLVPILSDARGVSLVLKKWERKQRVPDAIVIEHPRWAGGHLGAAKVADLTDPRFDFERVLPEVNTLLRTAGLEGRVPLIAAGGVRRFEDIARLQALGAAAVQLGTAFVATTECDADPAFKRVLAEARDDELVEFVSVAGLPARAVATPWLQRYGQALPRLQAVAQAKSRCTLAFDCLAQCGLRDGQAGWGQFCIDQRLAAALRGDVAKGLFFRGVGALPFGAQIASVRQLLERLFTAGVPLGTPPAPPVPRPVALA